MKVTLNFHQITQQQENLMKIEAIITNLVKEI